MTYENNPIELGLERLVDFTLPDDACISIARAASKIKAQGVKRQPRRRRDGRRALPGAQQRQVARAQGRAEASRRQGDLGHLLAAAQEEHRLLLAPDRDGQGRHEGARSRPSGARGRRRSCRCRSSTRTSGSRSPERRVRAGRGRAADGRSSTPRSIAIEKAVKDSALRLPHVRPVHPALDRASSAR